MLETFQIIVSIVLAFVFLVMGVMHFMPGPARVMARIVPPKLRFSPPFTPLFLVYFTGLCEIAGGIGMLVTGMRLLTGCMLVLFLIAVFPANAYAAAHPEKFGSIAMPLNRRLALQILLAALIIFAVFPN